MQKCFLLSSHSISDYIFLQQMVKIVLNDQFLAGCEHADINAKGVIVSGFIHTL